MYRQLFSKTRSGMAMIYVICSVMMMVGVASLAVDYGRVRIAKSQLQAAADAAALYGMTGLATSVTTAQNRAIDAAHDNLVDGTPLILTTSDIEFGLWDPRTRTFTPLSGAASLSATAMRINAVRAASRGTGIITPLATIVGRGSVDIHSSSIAALGQASSITIPATGSPWLAGMPAGSKIAGAGAGSTAPANSPVQVNLPVVPGQTIFFRDNSGTTGDTSTGKVYGLDGDLTRTTIAQVAVNKINTTTAPLNALMGIFLDDNAPSSSAMPAAKPNYSTSASRDFSTLSPGLKQVFFVGDGMNSSNYLQGFVVPAGATRLFLGVMDENGFWWDNTGSLNSIVFTGKPKLVR